MRMYDLITKKKHGEELTDAEIREFITEYTAGNVPDYQVSALMMAIYFKGMCDRKTSTLTMAMSTSGDTVDLSEFGTLTVDKHSTGGVGGICRRSWRILCRGQHQRSGGRGTERTAPSGTAGIEGAEPTCRGKHDPHCRSAGTG